MISQPEQSASLARDTVFAAVMITCNIIAGAALLVQALRRRTAVFNPAGTNAALATVLMLAVLTATACRPASIWRSARRWPASA